MTAPDSTAEHIGFVVTPPLTVHSTRHEAIGNCAIFDRELDYDFEVVPIDQGHLRAIRQLAEIDPYLRL